LISKIEAVDRMNTCDERLLRRTEEEIERMIIAAADRKCKSVFYRWESDFVREAICKRLAASGYRLFENHNGVTIAWCDLDE